MVVLRQPFILETRMLLILRLVERNRVLESNVSEELLRRVSPAVDMAAEVPQQQRARFY